MKKLKITLFLSLLVITGINAQDTAETEKFVPSGEPSVKIFTNVHSTFVDGDNTSAFEVQRAYFGYSYSFSENFSTKLTLDVGDPNDGGKLQMTAYLKNAALEYHKGNLKVNFGLIGLYGFKTQEKQWGYRYIYKSFQDQHKFGSSADLGASMVYKFSDLISADAMILNGEGYKNLQSDDTYKGAVGVTITPMKSLQLRAYYDYMSTDVAQQTIALFGGYKADNIKIGAEYNMQKNHALVEDQDFMGISLYTAVEVGKKLNFFGRFDNLTSTNAEDVNGESWNIAKDGQAYIFGLEYTPVKGIKISPNFQGWNPSEDGADFESSAYLNIEISF
ncbi:MAG: porin [Marinilabiliales bacterium]|nr:MAG: porin [Marinilabiliales bacterium]